MLLIQQSNLDCACAVVYSTDSPSFFSVYSFCPDLRGFGLKRSGLARFYCISILFSDVGPWPRLCYYHKIIDQFLCLIDFWGLSWPTEKVSVNTKLALYRVLLHLSTDSCNNLTAICHNNYEHSNICSNRVHVLDGCVTV